MVFVACVEDAQVGVGITAQEVAHEVHIAMTYINVVDGEQSITCNKDHACGETRKPLRDKKGITLHCSELHVVRRPFRERVVSVIARGQDSRTMHCIVCV